jgi:fatty aldehyde-generating acyl-ACP reductase
LDTFAFIIHPLDPKRDIQRKYPFLGRIATDWMIDHIAPLFPPVYLSEVQGIQSEKTGKQVKGWLIACPLTPKHFCRLPVEEVYRKIIETGWLAERLGAKILGLGAYTSVVGDGGLTVAEALDIPVTTGDSYTIAIALDAVRKAAHLLGICLANSSAAIVGATGAIGKVCATVLANEVSDLILLGRDESRLKDIKDNLDHTTGCANIIISANMDILCEAELVITVTSDSGSVIQPHHLRTGSVVCDVARPRDVALQVAEIRKDVLVIDGGIVDVPGQVNFNFNFGLPPGKAFACMAETIALALEGKFADYTLGKDTPLDRVQEIDEIANRHGFRQNGFRSFERPVSEAQIEAVRRYSKKRIETEKEF